MKEFLTEEEEKEIIAFLDQREWDTTLSRRTQHFGFEYNYKSATVTPTESLSGPILNVAEKLRKAGVADFNQCIVNEYYRHQGIADHTDRTIFGPIIASISLGSEAIMTFKYQNQVQEILLLPRSALCLTDDARYKWTHGISKNVTYIVDGEKVVKPEDYRRISLTFRTV